MARRRIGWGSDPGANCDLFSLIGLMLLCVAIFSRVASAEDFVARRTHLLDYRVFANTTNFLFRGNMPKNASGDFAYSELISTFQNVTHHAGGPPLPPTFQLIDYSMLVSLDPKEHDDVKLEEDFFRANPQLGHLVKWPLLTLDALGPCLQPSSSRESKAKSGKWDVDDVPSKVDTLFTTLNTHTAVSTILYIHCEAGVDRTGELSGSYMMQHKNSTYAAALAFDDNVEPRAITTEAKHGMEWYSLYLQYAKNIDPGFRC